MNPFASSSAVVAAGNAPTDVFAKPEAGGSERPQPAARGAEPGLEGLELPVQRRNLRLRRDEG